MVSRVSSSLISMPLRPVRVLLVALVAASVLLTGCLLAPEKTRAARGMELALQDDATFLVGGKRVPRERAFTYARQLGVTRLRVNLLWAYTMNKDVYDARRKPARIQYLFDSVDSLVDQAADNGIRVHLSLTGPAPRWARPKPSLRQAWYKPNTREFGKWAGVVAEHFAGRVDRYSIWNEPNWKTWLGPLKSAPGALPQPVHARLRGDQGRRPAREGADRRDEPERACRAVDRAAGVPAQGGLRQQQVQAREPLPHAEGGRLRAPPLRLPARAQLPVPRRRQRHARHAEPADQGARQAVARRARCARTAAAACRST